MAKEKGEPRKMPCGNATKEELEHWEKELRKMGVEFPPFSPKRSAGPQPEPTTEIYDPSIKDYIRMLEGGRLRKEANDDEI